MIDILLKLIFICYSPIIPIENERKNNVDSHDLRSLKGTPSTISVLTVKCWEQCV